MTLFNKPCIAKVTEPKSWRVAALDERLRSDRIQNEARSNLRCVRLGIPVAPIIFIDKSASTIVMEELTGPTVKRKLLDSPPDDPTIPDIMKQVGILVARLHNAEIIHSDLTTSNFVLHDGEVRVIDFGLSHVSAMAEDKAVDLYVLERAFDSSHPGRHELLDLTLGAYAGVSVKAQDVFARLKKVRSRGRKRSMVG
jgi:TP53 regulating kinase-like protein